MTQRHRNHSEKIEKIEKFNFEDIQNYHTAKLLRQDSEKANSDATVIHSENEWQAARLQLNKKQKTKISYRRSTKFSTRRANDKKLRKHAYMFTAKHQRCLWSCDVETADQDLDQTEDINQFNQLSKMFLTKSNHWLSIWWRTSEVKGNFHRNIARIIYFAHSVSNLHSTLIFKDSRKNWKSTVTQLHWWHCTVRWRKEHWQECEKAEKDNENYIYMSKWKRSAIWWFKIRINLFWKSQSNIQSNNYATQWHSRKIKDLHMMIKSLTESKAQLQDACANKNHCSDKNITLTL